LNITPKKLPEKPESRGLSGEHIELCAEGARLDAKRSQSKSGFHSHLAANTAENFLKIQSVFFCEFFLS